MMLKVYLVERSLKWLMEVPTDNDTDFTVRQFLYQLLAQRLKVRDYLHYGLYIHSDQHKKNGKGDEDNNDGIEELNPVLALSKTIDELLSEYGLGVTFVIRRRIMPHICMQKFDSQPVSTREVELLFTQVSHENIELMSYNEESVALKQASILEVIHNIKKQGVDANVLVDNKVLNDRIDIRELHKIYPQHLLTFFNKKSVWKRIQDAKVDLPFMSNVIQLQLLYLILSFQQQPQVCTHYFPVRVVEYSKPLKTLMSATLNKKYQTMLTISPLGVGIANDYSPDPKSIKHKKNVMIIPYDKIGEMHVMLAHPSLPPGSIAGSFVKEDSTIRKKLFQLQYVDTLSQQLRIVVESERCSEMIRLIQDYQKEPSQVGWDAQCPKPKNLEQMLNSVRKQPLKLDYSTVQKDYCFSREYQVYLSISDRLRDFFNDKSLYIRDVITLYRDGCPNLAQYAYYNCLQDEYELYQLGLIQNIIVIYFCCCRRYTSKADNVEMINRMITKLASIFQCTYPDVSLYMGHRREIFRITQFCCGVRRYIICCFTIRYLSLCTHQESDSQPSTLSDYRHYAQILRIVDWPVHKFWHVPSLPRRS